MLIQRLIPFFVALFFANVVTAGNILEFERDKPPSFLSPQVKDILSASQYLPIPKKPLLLAQTQDKSLIPQDRPPVKSIISLNGDLSDQIGQLEKVLEDDPENLEARILLARYYSWVGRLISSVEEANTVLEDFPDNKEALLIKADSSSWRNDFGTAIPIYQRLLESELDFDTHLGYIQALLGAGKMQLALDSRNKLDAKTDKQRSKLSKLDWNMAKYFRRNFTFGYSEYHDTEKNVRHEYLGALDFYVGDFNLMFNSKHIEATDPLRNNKAMNYSLKVKFPISNSVLFQGGAGAAKSDNTIDHYFATWFANTWLNLSNLNVYLEARKFLFAETAQIIENEIRVTSFIAQSTYTLTDRVSIFGKFLFKNFSDNNHALGIKLAPQILLWLQNPRVALGYRFEQQNYRRQTGSGYFDPDRLISNQAFLKLSFRRSRFNFWVEGFLGEQITYRRGRQGALIGGGSGSFSYDIFKYLTMNGSAEGGNFALESSSGFEYYLFAFNLILHI
jgi:tetratricopeptide (TPR) repeat protein